MRRTSQILNVHYASLPSENLNTTVHNLGGDSMLQYCSSTWCALARRVVRV